jgi:hypothetical protein
MKRWRIKRKREKFLLAIGIIRGQKFCRQSDFFVFVVPQKPLTNLMNPSSFELF